MKIADTATDDGGGSGIIITATVTANAGYTGAALTIDGSDLDMHLTILTVVKDYLLMHQTTQLLKL